MKFTLLDKFTKRFGEAAGSIPAVFLAMAILLISQQAFSQGQPNNFKTIHVKFKEQFRPKSSSGQSARSGITGIDKVSEKHKALSIERIFPDAGVYEAAHKAYGLHLWYEIKFSKDASLHEAIADYENLDYFHNVEECREYTASWETDNALPELPTGTNDALFSKQWHFKNTGQTGGKPGADINLLKAWQVETGSPSVIVAVIDHGINLDHPDLVDALWTNSDEIPGNGIDDDYNGYVDDVHGYGFGDKTPTIFPHGHATHVAGTIGAVSNNGIGVSGIAGGTGFGDGVRLMSCATFGNFKNGGFEAAMVYAADNGAVISQNSWGGGSTAIEAAIDYFIDRAGYDNSATNFNSNIQTGPMAGGLVIFSAGNSSTSNPNVGYPASYASVIAVGSTDHNDVRSDFSNYGKWVDISAPGSSVWSTSGSGYSSMSGTSMACPHVSGVAALVTSNLQRPGLHPSDVWNRLRLSAHPISIENPFMDGYLGAGRLDAFLALKEPDAIPPAAILDFHAAEVHYSSVLLKWTATGGSGNVGQAAKYEIRFSSSPINELNFRDAQLSSNPPLPPTAGDQVTFTMSLPSSSSSYIAIKSIDLFNNSSAISNIVHVETFHAPTLTVMTPNLSEELYTGGISSRNILIKNTGGDALSIRLGVPDISPAPVGSPTGAKGRLFGVNTSKNTIEELNPKSGVVIGSIALPEPSSTNMEDLAFDGVNLFYGKSDKIYKLNAHTGEVLRSFIVPGASVIRGLAWSGRYLYASIPMWGGFGNRILEIDSDDGSVVREFEYLANELTFAGKRGTLFMTVSGKLVELNIATGTVLREMQLGGNPSGLGYSEVEDLIFVSDESTIKAIQPDTGAIVYSFSSLLTTLASDESKPAWLTTKEQIVAIAPGQTASLPVTFIGTGLPTGEWAGTVNVIPVNAGVGPIAIPVALKVTSAADIETAVEIDLGPQFLGYTIDTVISVENRGISDLIISNIRSNDSRVTSSIATVTLTAGQKIPITVTITPAIAGPIDASLTFSSNDPDEGVLLIPVRAEIFISPAIQLNPVSLSTIMSTGERKTLNFTAKNTGGSVLHWKVNSTGFSESAVGQSDSSNPSDSAYVSGLGEFTLKAQSPEQLTCLSYDPQSGFIYAKSLVGTSFYRYDPVADSWATIGLAPGTFAGQATYLNGKIYHPGVQLSVYTIATNSWTTVPFPVQAETGNVTSDGQYIYMNLGPAPPSGAAFYRYDPVVNTWVRLADIPRDIYAYGGLNYHSGVIYAHEDATTGFAGDGNTQFFKYYVASNTWITSTSISGKASSGSAIDPTGRKYFVVGAPYARPGMGVQMSILDVREGSWQKIETPFNVESFSGLVFVGKAGFTGIYLSQGNGGTGFARYETSPGAEWISITPSQGNLTPGATQTFTVDLNAAGMDGGTYTGNLNVYSSHPSIEETIPLTVTVVGAPEISMNLTTTDVGEALIGKDKGARLTIKNIGTAPLIVSNITTDRPDFDISNSSFTVQTGESIDVVAIFRPTTAGIQTGTFTFHNNDPDGGAIQFVLKGNGVYPPIPSITPGVLSANLLTGATSVQSITISNSGGSTMTYGIDAPPMSDWIKCDSYGDLAAGQTKTIDVTIDASGKATGIYEGKIRFYDLQGFMTEISVTMTVTGVADILAGTNSLKFGDQFVNFLYDSVIQIKNDGVLPLSISTINSDNAAFSISAIAPLSLAPGESISAMIRFSPNSVSAQSGKITITSNDPDEGTYVIPLTGNGIDPPLLTSNPTTLTAFALTNESQTQTFTLINSGGSVLKWRIMEQSDRQPLSTNDDTEIEEPMTAGDFTSHGPTPEKLISPVVNPASGLIFAQAPQSQRLYVYNPSSRVWAEEVSRPGIGNFESGGAVFLNSKMYCVYPENSLTIFVYNVALADWTSIPNGLGVGTGTITTDGKILYLAGGGNFKSFNPKKATWTNLPLPTITLDGAGGISYYNGEIYAHEGNGNGFAKYTIATGIWENLVPLPDKALLGSAIDPVRKRYYAYGKNSNGHSYVYEYDLTSNLWNVLTFPLFEVSDGGMVHTPNSEGIYLIQGKLGNGLARYEPSAHLTWLRASPLAGEILASESQTIGVNFNAYGLNTGTYNGTIQVISNDPNQSMVSIPTIFHVTNPGPSIEVPVEITATVERSTLYTTQLKIENTGHGLLRWRFAHVLPDWLIIRAISGEIGPGTTYVDVGFYANSFAPDVLDYPLEIFSNDIFHPIVSTRLKYTIITNHAPVVSDAIPDQVITSSTQILLHPNFFDPDNDPLSFFALSSSMSIATVEVSGSILNIQPSDPGVTLITVYASDIFNFTASTTFSVTVNPVVTAIEPVKIEPSLSAIPNPFEKDVTLRYHTERPGRATIFVFDISGKIVWQASPYEEVHGQNEIEINGKQFVPGIYNCRILRNGVVTSTVRLVRY